MVSPLLGKAFAVKLSYGLVTGNIRSNACSDSDKEKIWIWVKIWTAEYKNVSNLYFSW